MVVYSFFKKRQQKRVGSPDIISFEKRTQLEDNIIWLWRYDSPKMFTLPRKCGEFGGYVRKRLSSLKPMAVLDIEVFDGDVSALTAGEEMLHEEIAARTN